jgi:hypothetical protein
MVQSLQLSDLAGSIRQDAIDQLSKIANEFSLSYTITEDTMTIVLPKYDVAELPVVGTVQVPLDDDEDAD